jgi:NADP-dependent 3-hydroxy acid dehydrogenase YdfG
MSEPIFSLSSDRVAIITGASSGIGRATALELAARGMRLCLMARSEPALREVAAAALAAGAGAVHVTPGDIRDEAAVVDAVAGLLDREGRIDILINNAGLSLNGPVDGYALDDWRTVIDTNLTGVFLMCRQVLPTMKRQQSGQILNVSSGAGRNGIRNMAAYCASKFGLIGFTESLGHEVRGDNIRVSVILPGSVATDFSRVANRQGGEVQTGDRDIGYAMLPEEAASALVAMLAQPPQAWMSEVVLRPLNLDWRRTITAPDRRQGE